MKQNLLRYSLAFLELKEVEDDICSTVYLGLDFSVFLLNATQKEIIIQRCKTKRNKSCATKPQKIQKLRKYAQNNLKKINTRS